MGLRAHVQAVELASFCFQGYLCARGPYRGMGIRTIAYRYDDLIRVHSLVLYAGLRARVQVVELASYRSPLRAVAVVAPVASNFSLPFASTFEDQSSF